MSVDNRIELIESAGVSLALIVRADFIPASTQFLTPDTCNQQIGFIVYPSGGVIKRHLHKPVERHLIGMSEVLVVRQGRAIVDIYDDEQRLVASREIQVGDVVVLTGGGHGFRMLEPTVLLEVKQGPYLGVNDKVLF